MDIRLFLVTTLLSVHVYAQLQDESSTVAGFNVKTTFQHEPEDKNVSVSTDASVERISTNQARVDVINDQASLSTTQKVEDTANSIYSTATQNPANDMTLDNIASRTTQMQETFSETTVGQEITPSLSTKVDERTSTTTIEKTTAAMTEKRQTDVTKTVSTLEESTAASSPDQFFKWLDSIHPENMTKDNVTDAQGSQKQSNRSEEPENFKGKTDFMNPDLMPPNEFMEWLDSIHPDSNGTSTVTIKNVIDTSIISTEKLIIVISTICGTFVLFVAILIAISCCRKKRNMRNDSEKSDFSMNSVVSIPHSVVSIPEKRKSDVFSTDKNGFNNVFMGIPANNEVWKNLEQLSPAASSVMPESTKM